MRPTWICRAEDACSHGPHVVGTILAKDNKVGVMGIFPGVEAYVVKVFSHHEHQGVCGLAYTSDVISAISKCVGRAAKIVNLSLGGLVPSVALERELDFYYNQGRTLCCCHGKCRG